MGATVTTPKTAEDLWNLPQDNLRHELIRGAITT